VVGRCVAFVVRFVVVQRCLPSEGRRTRGRAGGGRRASTHAHALTS
jgi:hypothetical protein